MVGYWHNFKRFIPLLQELVSRDMKVKYRRSILGIVWSLLNPLLIMVVMTIVFSNIFRFDIPNFPIYYLTGSIILSFFSEATSGAMSSVFESGALIKKVYIPKYLFALEKVLFAFVNLGFSLIAVIIVMIFTQTPLHFTMLLAPVPLLLLFVFCIGIGLILATVATFFRDIMHLYGVFLTALTYLTPVFYPLEMVPDWLQSIIQFNPLYRFINYLRLCVLYGTVPTLADHLYCVGFAAVALLIGVVVFKRHQNKFILYL